METKKKTANQEISSWLATVGSDTPLQHSNPASLYLASLQGSEASRTTARSVMKQIAILCDQTPDTFPWHRLDRATVLALMEKLKQKGVGALGHGRAPAALAVGSVGALLTTEPGPLVHNSSTVVRGIICTRRRVELVTAHIDHWDSASQLLVKIPVAGRLVRLLLGLFKH